MSVAPASADPGEGRAQPERVVANEEFATHLARLEEILASPALTKSTSAAIADDLRASRASTALAREILARRR